MRLFKMELYKLHAGRFLYVSLALLVAFFLFYVWTWIDQTTVQEGDTLYTGFEAVARNKEIVKQYEGPFTRETAEQIIADYGFSGYIGENRMREGNFCSQFVTDNMTDFRQTEEKPKEFSNGEFYEYNIKPLVDGSRQFGYLEGWEGLRELFWMLNICLNIWLILAIAPVFSGEYAQNTAGLLLTTEHGKARDIKAKIGSALLTGGVVYIGINLLFFLCYLTVYGTSGLGASMNLVQIMPQNWTAGQYFLLLYLLGLQAVFINVCITLLVSSKCKKNQHTIVMAVLLYLLPWVVRLIATQMLPLQFRTVMIIALWIRLACGLTPLYLPLYLEDYTPYYINGMWVLLMWIAAAAAVVLVIRKAYQSYRQYQVE